MANNFEFYTGLKGYHVCSNAVSWKPYVGQKITFKREHNNLYHKFAVAGKVTMKEKIELIVARHASREFSRYIDTSGFLLEKWLNLKLKFTKKNQWLLQ